MKGIILAGGNGTRLYPLTLVTSKQLLPIYDKPMIYYPLSTLMLAGIRDILIISTENDLPRFEKLLGDGSKLGIKISYKVQPKPEGLAQAFTLGKDFIGDDACAMILGDNIFYGAGLVKHLRNSVDRAEQGIPTIYGYYVKDPKRFGIVDFDEETRRAISIEEKPEEPKTNYCVTGLYFYPKGVSQMAEKVTPSDRGEYEITTLNNMYIEQGEVHVTVLGRGYTWIDIGTHESLTEAILFVKMIGDHQDTKISCPEEVAYINQWITKKQLQDISAEIGSNSYGDYLTRVSKRRHYPNK